MEQKNANLTKEKQEQLKQMIDNVTDDGTLDYLITYISLMLEMWQ